MSTHPKVINPNPKLTIDDTHFLGSSRLKTKKRVKRSLLNHSMAKELHQGDLEKSIFLMSDSFKFGLKDSQKLSRKTCTNSRSQLKRNNANVLQLSYKNPSPQRLFSKTEQSPTNAYIDRIDPKLNLDTSMEKLDETTVLNPVTDI